MARFGRITALLLLAVATALIVVLTDEVRHIVRRTTDAELQLTFGDAFGNAGDPDSGLPRALTGMAVLDRATAAEIRRVVATMPVARAIATSSDASRSSRAADPESLTREWIRRVFGRPIVSGVVDCRSGDRLEASVIAPGRDPWCIVPPPGSSRSDMTWYVPSGRGPRSASQFGPIGRQDILRADEEDLLVGPVMAVVAAADGLIGTPGVCVGSGGPVACDATEERTKRAQQDKVEIGQVSQIYYLSMRSEFHAVWQHGAVAGVRPPGRVNLWGAYASTAANLDDMFVSTPYLDGTGRGFVATACAPLLSGGVAAGVLCADYPIGVEAPGGGSPSIRVHASTIACAPAGDLPRRAVPRIIAEHGEANSALRYAAPGLSSVRFWQLDTRQVDALLPTELCHPGAVYGRPMLVPLSHIHNIDGLWAVPIRDTGGGTREVWFVEDVDVPLQLGTLGVIYGFGALLALALAAQAHGRFATRVVQQAQRARLRGIGTGIVLVDFSEAQVRYVSGNERAEELLGCEFVSVDLDGTSGPDHSAAKLLFTEQLLEYVASDNAGRGAFQRVTVEQLRERRRHGLSSDYFARRRDVARGAGSGNQTVTPPAGTWVQFHSAPLAFAGGSFDHFRAVSAISEAPAGISTALESTFESLMTAS